MYLTVRRFQYAFVSQKTEPYPRIFASNRFRYFIAKADISVGAIPRAAPRFLLSVDLDAFRTGAMEVAIIYSQRIR